MKKQINIAQNKGRGRPPKVVSDERTRLVAELILQGKPRSQIVNYCMENFNIERSSVERQIFRANAFIRENYKVDKEDVVHKHIEMYYTVFNTFKDYDGSTAIKALNAVEKLLNLHKPETLMQNNTLNVNLKDLTVSELKELLNK